MKSNNSIPEHGFLRLHQVIGSKKNGITPIIPVSKATWYAGIASGRYPKPTRALGERITAWSCESIREYIESVNAKVGEK